jgi:hypothetical protein
MSSNVEDIDPTIVVNVDKSCSPIHVLRVDSQTRSNGYISEASTSSILIQVAGVVLEVRFEDVEPTVVVVIGDSYSHPGLLRSVLAECTPSDHTRFLEGPVVAILKEQALSRVYCHIDVRPLIIVEVK